ncbi:MAG: phosphoribosyl-ATP diphosphatase [Proteobacteria bacterium]|nr:phosphoribosyl-ATP diphosphatase [Pseudomonadota bacterium]
MQPDIQFIARLETIVRERLEAGGDTSYTARLAAAGTRRIAQKIGEEGVELALAAAAGSKQETIDEAADLVYHLLVLLAERGLSLEDVAARLQVRHEA